VKIFDQVMFNEMFFAKIDRYQTDQKNTRVLYFSD